MAKSARSATAQDKTEYKGFRLSPREARRLDLYCEIRGLSVSEAMRTGLNLLLDKARIPDPGPVGESEAAVRPTVYELLRAALDPQYGAAPAGDGVPKSAAPQD